MIKEIIKSTKILKTKLKKKINDSNAMNYSIIRILGQITKELK